MIKNDSLYVPYGTYTTFPVPNAFPLSKQLIFCTVVIHRVSLCQVQTATVYKELETFEFETTNNKHELFNSCTTVRIAVVFLRPDVHFFH